MNTTFENELRKIFGNDDLLKNTKYIGRACFGDLGSDMRLRAEFISLEISNQFNALKLTAINRTDGEVDKITVRLSELLGEKYTTNPNFRPHLWLHDNKLDWYVYQPTQNDYKLLKETVKDYASLYMAHDFTLEQKPSVKKQLAENKTKAAGVPKKQTKNKTKDLEV